MKPIFSDNRRSLYFSLVVMLLVFATETAVAQAYHPLIAQPAPAIQLKTNRDSTLVLSDLRGKVVLVDFWASWCGPCRVWNRNVLKPLYNEFSGQGLEIVAVSLDVDKRAWLRAIDRDKATWWQVNDPGNWQAPTARRWMVEFLPSTFLIDKNGMVRALDPSDAEMRKWIPELLQESYMPVKGKITLEEGENR